MRFLTPKEVRRFVAWILFIFTIKTRVLRSANTVIEVGAGRSLRIQSVLLLFLFRKTYLSVDLSPNNMINFPFPFKRRFIKADFFDLKQKVDLIIFDHSVDDILAFMLSNKKSYQDYSEIMDNIRLFDYRKESFRKKVKKILSTARGLLNPRGKIIISNYPTRHNKLQGTIGIMRGLIPCLVDEAKKMGYKIEFLSRRFMLLSKTKINSSSFIGGK